MKVAVIGLGLIGGSFEKASLRAGHEVVALHHGNTTGFEDADLVLVCLPPDAVVPWIKANAPRFRAGAAVVDIAGVKREILKEFQAAFPTPPAGWTFVGGHPMAGREVSGYANSLATLFDGASMILVPLAGTAVPAPLKDYFRSVGFGRVVVTTPEHHDEMIAFTSQIAHVLACSYVLSPLAPSHAGYSAGSYRDVSRVARINADMWADLFIDNKDALVREIDDLVSNLMQFKYNIVNEDSPALKDLMNRANKIKEEIG